MKLLFCPYCVDFVVLRYGYDRSCECTRCKGHYIMGDPEQTHAVVSGPQVQVIGIENLSFMSKIKRVVSQMPTSDGRDDYKLPQNFFKAWIFGPNALKVTKDTKERWPAAVVRSVVRRDRIKTFWQRRRIERVMQQLTGEQH